MKKELIFLGPPACGKGTQTSKLSEYLNFPHVDTGSLLRAAVKNIAPDAFIIITDAKEVFGQGFSDVSDIS